MATYSTVRALKLINHDGIDRIPGQTTGRNAQDFVVADTVRDSLVAMGVVSVVSTGAAAPVSLRRLTKLVAKFQDGNVVGTQTTDGLDIGGGSSAGAASSSSVSRIAAILAAAKQDGFDRRLQRCWKTPKTWVAGYVPAYAEVLASTDGLRYYICAKSPGNPTTIEPSGTTCGVIPDGGANGPSWFYFGPASSPADMLGAPSVIAATAALPAQFAAGRHIVVDSNGVGKYISSYGGHFKALLGEKNYAVSGGFLSNGNWIIFGDGTTYAFTTDSQYVGFQGSPQGMNIWVDGVPVYPGTINAGTAGNFWGLQFSGPRKARKIMCQVGYHVDFYVDAQAQMSAPMGNGLPLKVLMFGDSWTGGVTFMTPNIPLDSPAGVLAQTLGLGPVIPFQAIGGTGIWQVGQGGAANPLDYASRFQANIDRGYFTAANPIDLVIVQGSINDAGATPAQLSAALTALLNKIYSVWPNCVTLVTDILWENGNGLSLPLNAAIGSAVSAFGNPNVIAIGGGKGGVSAAEDAIINTLNQGPNTASATSNYYIGVPANWASIEQPGGNTAHPVFAGNYWIGQNLARLIWRAFGIPD